jgi:hypothetical protein
LSGKLLFLFFMRFLFYLGNFNIIAWSKFITF